MKPKEIDYFEITMKKYHGEIVASIQFGVENELIKTSLYIISEINNILTLWRMGELCDSFGIGIKLADKHSFQIFYEGSI